MANSDSMQHRVVAVLGTGGTISGRASSAVDNLGYTAGEVDIQDLLVGISAPQGFELQAEQIAQLDSKDMSFEVWRHLARRCAHWLSDPRVHGIVITHGTDTLEETAYFLQCVLAPSKPIVLTCAMRPSTSLSPDGPQNVRDAVALASTSGVQGVLVVCAGAVHSSEDVQKVHTYRLDAFTSGDAGTTAFVEEGVVRQLRPWPSRHVDDARRQLAAYLSADAPPRVEIVFSHAGCDRDWFEALLRASSMQSRPLAGLVIAATGNGTVHHELEASVLKATQDGLQVLRATRCSDGPIFPNAHACLPDAGHLTPVKARIRLMLQLLLR